jgi:hypothetical protein
LPFAEARIDRCDELPMNLAAFRAAVLANFLELRHGEVQLRRILIPRTPVNRALRIEDSSPVHHHHYNVGQ